MKITIAHFGTHYVGMPGGVEKLTCYLASALVNRGHEVTVLYRDGVEGAPYFPIDPRVRQINILFDHGKKVIQEKLPLYLRVYREISRLFSQSMAQGINAKYKGRAYGPKIKYWMDKYPADVVISCSAPSTVYTVLDAGCTKPLITLFRGDPSVQMPLLSDEERKAVGKSASIQVLWPSKKEISRKYFPHVPVFSIGNAVFPADKDADPGASKKTHLISCVGNVSGRKNQKLLLKAFMMLAPKYPDWKLEFWGEKDSHYAKTMEDMVRQHHLEHVVFLKGKTNHIGDVYAKSDIFCIPSESEGFPQGLAEAMSAGLPAVGLRRCGGTNELIQDGKTGFLVDETEEDLKNALEKLMKDPKLRAQMGQEGKAFVAQYAPEKMWDAWENVLIQTAAGENPETGL